MNRLGLNAADSQTLIDNYDTIAGFTPSLFMSHLANGEMPDDAMNDNQRQRFDALLDQLPDAPPTL